MYLLIDCNNFFVSCERVFNPKLWHKPVVVLSSNDGCIVARSAEVKELGVPMGAPFFEWRELLQKHDAEVFSSNFRLYGDISHRFMEILRQFTPEVEMYSIDEAFLFYRDDFINTHHTTWQEIGSQIRQTIWKWLGVPVSVGIAPTKTLAKVAAEIVKKTKSSTGVGILIAPNDIEHALGLLPVGAIWGVGRRYSKMLLEQGVRTALDFKNQEPDWVRKKMTVFGSRMQMELCGVSCMDLQDVEPTRKSIVCSRSFGRAVTQKQHLTEALAMHVAKACEKMRARQLLTQYISVFAYAGSHQFGGESLTFAVTMPVPLDFTPEITRLAWRCLDQFFKPGLRYKKIGVMLGDLVPFAKVQYDLFETAFPNPKKSELMRLLDQVNQKWGDGGLQYAAQGLKKPWQAKTARRSPEYTTSWADLPKAKA